MTTTRECPHCRGEGRIPMVRVLRTDVPVAWAHRPQEWWEHVRGCDACQQYWDVSVGAPS